MRGILLNCSMDNSAFRRAQQSARCYSAGMSSAPNHDPDIEKFLAAQKRARSASFGRGLRLVALMMISGVLAIAAGGAIASWDAAGKRDRLERYRRGELVIVRRGESVGDTSPSPALPLVVGGFVGLVAFGAGSAVFMRDATYLRGLGILLRR